MTDLPDWATNLHAALRGAPRDSLAGLEWVDDALAGRRRPGHAALACLSALTDTPMQVLVGDLPADRVLSLALRAGTLNIDDDVLPAVKQAASALDDLRLLLSWYPDVQFHTSQLAHRIRATGIPRTLTLGLLDLAERCGVAVIATVMLAGVQAVIVHDDLDDAWQAVVLVADDLDDAGQRRVFAEVLTRLMAESRDLLTVIRDGDALATPVAALGALPTFTVNAVQPWAARLALDAYRQGWVPARVVANMLGRPAEAPTVERELAEQGWAPDRQVAA